MHLWYKRQSIKIATTEESQEEEETINCQAILGAHDQWFTTIRGKQTEKNAIGEKKEFSPTEQARSKW